MRNLPSPLAQRYASTDYRRQPCVAGSAFAVKHRDLVGEAGFEPAASWFQTNRANLTALLPVAEAGLEPATFGL